MPDKKPTKPEHPVNRPANPEKVKRGEGAIRPQETDEQIKARMIRREGKTKEQYQAELDATRVVRDGDGWPPQPTDGEDDEA